jgi:hypothetical protein
LASSYARNAANAVTAPKSRQQNRPEGFALTAFFQGFPTFAMAVLIVKIGGSHQIVNEKGGAAIFVVLASIFHALVTPWLGPNSQNSSRTATSRCSSMRPCRSPKRSRSGGRSRRFRCSW